MPHPDPDEIRQTVQDMAIERRQHDRRRTDRRRLSADDPFGSACEAVAVLVAARLEEALARARLSQAQAAAKAGVSPTTLMRTLKTYDVRLSTLVRLAAAAGCDVQIVFQPATAPQETHVRIL